MKNVNEAFPIHKVLEVADEVLMSTTGYRCVAVHVTSGDPSLPEHNHHEGVLCYFPGITINELYEGTCELNEL